MPYDYIEEYQKQDDETIWLFRDKDAQEKIDTSSTETDYANPLSLETMNAQLAENTKIKLEPIQDLHGFNKPWIGGAGKNICPISSEPGRSYGGITFINNYNGSWTIDGDATASTYPDQTMKTCELGILPSGKYTASLQFTNGSFSNTVSVRIGKGSSASYVGSGYGKYTFTADGTSEYYLTMNVTSGYSPDNETLFIQVEQGEQVTSYSPYENICSISGHDQIDILGCGKNLANPDSVCNLYPNPTYNVIYENANTRSFIIKCNSGDNYTVSKKAGQRFRIGFTNAFPTVNEPITGYNENDTATSISVIVPQNANYMITYIWSSSVDTDTAETMIASVQIEKGEETTSFEPYTSSNNLSIDLPSTIYGGVLDLESGELVVDRAIVDLGDLDWTDLGTAISGAARFKTTLTNKPVRSDLTNGSTSYCSHYSLLTDGGTYTANKDGYTISTTDIVFFIDAYKTSSTSAFKTAMSGVHVVYTLQDEYKITIQLTPHQLSLLKAQNNLTTSQYTQIKVTYRNGVFVTLEPVSEDNDGLMSRLDKVKLDSIADDATKTESSTTNGNIKINGTETQVYDDSEIKGELSTDTTTIEGNPLNFTTLSAQKSKSTIIDIEPIQDLHGYDKPWVGGAGKNLCYWTSGNNKVIAHCKNGITYTYSMYIITDTGCNLKKNTSSGDVVVANLTGTAGNRVSASFTADEDFDLYLNGYSQFGDKAEKLQLEVGQTATIYELYENICSISGRSEIDILGCGKNLWGHGITGGGFGNAKKLSDDIIANFTISAKKSISKQLNVCAYDENGTKIGVDHELIVTDQTSGSYTYTNIDKVVYIAIYIVSGASGDEQYVYDIQIEKGTSPTSYKLYTKSTDLTINLGQTVYGGTLDVEKGELVVDKAIQDLGDLTWEYTSRYGMFTSGISSVVKKPISELVSANIITSHYEVISWNDFYNPGGTEQHACAMNISGYFAISTTETNPSTFKTAVSGQKLCYELSTPITLQLTPNEISLLEGVNNISILDDNASAKLTYRNGKVATLGDLLDLEKKLTDEEPYGFIEHMSILDPAQRIEYIGKNKNYSPMTINLAGDHLANYNEWYDFPVIKENKPYMIKVDGTVDYALDPNDYTKKFDGSASDVANTSYTGGAFAWIPKTYKREFTVGDDRYVYISTKKLSDEYEAIGFIDENGLEHDGAWIPMFYGTEITQDGTVKIMTLATGAPTQNRNTDTQKTYLTNANPDTLFFGGAIVKVLTDIMIMLGKNSDVQAVFGTGNMSGGNGAQYMKDNACIDGGAFYGTTTNNVLNKAFHSLVLLTQNQWQRDPYTLNIQGEYIVSPYYKYDLTGDSYVKTGVFVTPPSSNNWVYPHKSVSVPHWGAEPVGPYSGSTTTGWADGQYTLANQLTDTTVRVVRRFARCDGGRAGGLRAVGLISAASDTGWSIGASPLLLSKGAALQ